MKSIVSDKINFTALSLRTDRSPAWELNFLSILPGIP